MNKKTIQRVTILLLVVIFLLILKSVFTSKPVIGIPGTSGENYAAAVRKAGGTPVMLPYDRSEIPKLMESLDAVLFTGGADIPPSVYGDEVVHPTVKTVTDERLDFEMNFAKAWLRDTRKPFLGICLGSQLLNVVQGGSLVQDIPSEFGGNHRIDHDISVEPDSKLHAILEQENVHVNSSHHQAVRDLGEGLRIVAKAPDGIVEAIEMDGDRFVLGVQWHPERMSEDKLQEKLFEAFVKAAARKGKVSEAK